MTESTKDILREIRGNEWDAPEFDGPALQAARRLARDWADRLEAAIIRECKAPEAVAAILHDRLYKTYFASACDNIGNVAAMREALEAVKKSIDDIGASALDCDLEILRDSLLQICARLSARIEKALAAPPRNCDVGSAEEQTARYRKFCSAHKYLGSDSSYLCKGFGKGKCPFFNSHTKSQCEFAWGQMPSRNEERYEG